MKKRKSPIPLTERLRDWSEGPDTAHLCDEAADEIERLRRELAEEVKNKKEFERDWLSACDQLTEARALLCGVAADSTRYKAQIVEALALLRPARHSLASEIANTPDGPRCDEMRKRLSNIDALLAALEVPR
jgi:hypothetical protein